MELIGAIGKQDYSIEIKQLDPRHFEVVVDGRRHLVDCVEVLPDQFSLLIGHRSREVRVSRDAKGRIDAHFFRCAYQVEMTDPMDASFNAAGAGGQAGEATLEAPMPGQVQRILVEEGDAVEEDQGLLVLVAMKMENQLGSPKAGKVKKILVEAGAAVDGGAPLIVVE